MLSNKFIRILVLVNGLIIPILVLVILFQVFLAPLLNNIEKEQGIIVGEELNRANKEGLALQGLSYDTPNPIHNSENFYMPVSIATYQEAKEIKIARSSAGDYSYALQQVANVVFLDKDYQVINTLLDKRASVSDLEIRQPPYNDEELDTSYHHLCFQIGFEDTNKDGKLNHQDEHDLYISNLDGSDLKQISFDVDIVSFHLNTKDAIINIRYKERSDESEEHKKINFAKYDLIVGKWIEYQSLNQRLLELEQILIAN